MSLSQRWDYALLGEHPLTTTLYASGWWRVCRAFPLSKVCNRLSGDCFSRASISCAHGAIVMP